MSGWEWFTWFNVFVLGLGSIAVFVLFLRQLPELMRRAEPKAQGSRPKAQDQRPEA